MSPRRGGMQVVSAPPSERALALEDLADDGTDASTVDSMDDSAAASGDLEMAVRGLRAELRGRIPDHPTRIEASWTLCRMAYEHPGDALRISEKEEVVEYMKSQLDPAVERPAAEAAAACLHTLCVVQDFVDALSDAETVRRLGALLDHHSEGLATAERLVTDVVGLIHKVAHANANNVGDGRPRHVLVRGGVVRTMLLLLRRTPSWFLDGPKLGVSVVPKRKKKSMLPALPQSPTKSSTEIINSFMGAITANDGASEASFDSTPEIAAAANERVVEDCLGTLRNLTEDESGRAAVMEDLDSAVGEFVRLIQDRGEFTKNVEFAPHLQAHGFGGYTFERVQCACLGILHHLLVDGDEAVCRVVVAANTVAVLVDLLNYSNNPLVQTDTACVMHCLATTPQAAQHMIACGAVLAISRLVKQGHNQITRYYRSNLHGDGDEPNAVDLQESQLADVCRMTDGAVGTLGNLAFYADRSHSVPGEAGEAPFARVIVSAGTVPVMVSLLRVTASEVIETKPSEVDAGGQLVPYSDGGQRTQLNLYLRQKQLNGVLEASASALRNLAFHSECVNAIISAGAVAVITGVLHTSKAGGAIIDGVEKRRHRSPQKDNVMQLAAALTETPSRSWPGCRRRSRTTGRRSRSN